MASEKLIHLNRDVDKSISLIGEELLNFVRAAVMAVVSVTAIVFKSPGIGCFSAVLFVAVIVLNIYFAPKHTHWEKEVLSESGKFNNLYHDAFDGAVTIRTSGLETQTEALFSNQIVRYLKSKKSARNLTLIQELSSGGLARLMGFGPVMAAIYFCASGKMSVGSVFFIFQFAMNLVGYAQQLFSGFNGMGKSSAGVERLWQLFADRSSDDADKEALVDVQSVFFRNVNIADGQQTSRYTFELYLEPGQIGVLAGKSGCGKSTCLNALMSFINFSGDVYINGTDVRNYSLESLYKNVSYVEQNPLLFDGTIYENILFGKLDAEPKEVFRAAEMACIHQEIESLPEKYNTRIGEAGQNLSGGQRQRIALARAFLKNAPVMILDECTSAVDEQTEERICNSIKAVKAHKIILMAAHRQKIINLADKIVQIES